MSLENVLTQLAEAQVKLWPDGDNLRIQAPKGALTGELRTLLVEHKDRLLQHLRHSPVDGITLPILEQWPDDRYQPFPLTDIQQAYWLGRQQLFELGNVACQTYLEFEGYNLDLARLGQSWQALIHRHAMLRAIVLPTGEQQILEDVPSYEIKCVDLIGVKPDAAATRLVAIRRDMTQRVVPTDQWPLFDIRATRLDEERIRLHIRVDMLAVDVSSTMLLFQEWGQLYQNSACRLPELSLSFRDYVLTAEKLEMMEPYRQSQAYWLNRVDSLPPAPELPLLPDPMTPSRPQFKRYTARLEAEPWTRLRQRAGQAGLTPTGVLLTAFADILAVWSRHPRFTLNLTVFNRLPVHPQVNDIVGDFTSTVLLAVDNTVVTPFIVRAQRLQQQLWQDLEHRHFSGTRVLRELARRSGGETNSLMPVVFTSTLGVGSADFLDFSTFGQLVYGSTQTPQVWLDHQLFEQNGALVFNWDVVEELFPPNLLAVMFESYCRRLKRLATEETAWAEIDQAWLPTDQLAQRKAINDTAAPVSEALLHTLFLAQIEARSGAKAVITPHHTLTYQALYDQANGLGHWLRERDVKPNTLVAVVMEKGWEQVVAVLGILMSGAAYLPIDPTLPPERQRFLLEQGEVNIALTQSQLAQKLTWPSGIQTLAVDTAN
ncbi:MAG: AMP-binding protein, partial [Anaerolineae bacterium]|nr:AMP-binding protein [Anaerolineae bacterium]